jgi:hypothetical protein
MSRDEDWSDDNLKPVRLLVLTGPMALRAGLPQREADLDPNGPFVGRGETRVAAIRHLIKTRRRHDNTRPVALCAPLTVPSPRDVPPASGCIRPVAAGESVYVVYY